MRRTRWAGSPRSSTAIKAPRESPTSTSSTSISRREVRADACPRATPLHRHEGLDGFLHCSSCGDCREAPKSVEVMYEGKCGRPGYRSSDGGPTDPRLSYTRANHSCTNGTAWYTTEAWSKSPTGTTSTFPPRSRIFSAPSNASFGWTSTSASP